MKKRTLSNLQYLFRHFSARLSERYNILITFEEYVELCKLPFIRSQKLKFNGDKSYYKGNIIIKTVKVNIYRSTLGMKPFLTALPINKNKKICLDA